MEVTMRGRTRFSIFNILAQDHSKTSYDYRKELKVSSSVTWTTATTRLILYLNITALFHILTSQCSYLHI